MNILSGMSTAIILPASLLTLLQRYCNYWREIETEIQICECRAEDVDGRQEGCCSQGLTTPGFYISLWVVAGVGVIVQKAGDVFLCLVLPFMTFLGGAIVNTTESVPSCPALWLVLLL